MCYQVFLSTDTDEDLSVNDSDLLKFSKDLPFQLPEKTLMYENLWHVQSTSVCSCSFRHLFSTELGFCEPEDWCPEDDDHIKATMRFASTIRTMLKRNIRLDCIDLWQDEPVDIGESSRIDVDFSKIKDSEFRFFENHHFTFIHT